MLEQIFDIGILNSVKKSELSIVPFPRYKTGNNLFEHYWDLNMSWKFMVQEKSGARERLIHFFERGTQAPDQKSNPQAPDRTYRSISRNIGENAVSDFRNCQRRFRKCWKPSADS